MEPIYIQEYTSDWERQFQEEREILKQVLGDKVMAIEHIGSTSVKGLVLNPF